MAIISLKPVSIKQLIDIKEDAIQRFIADDPSVLGLGELETLNKEKIIPSGGRLDLLLGDEETRYEVEVQLGATDPSHIIRTIEYWDSERKRYPQYDHCAVIVAEDITSRFMNVISLFNGAIPLIAIKMTAYKNGNDYNITFTRVLDRISLGTEEDDKYEVTDRNYWETRSSSKIMKCIDNIYLDIKPIIGAYEMKYNKFYIGLSKHGTSNNFVHFKPKKNFFYLYIRSNTGDKLELLESVGLNVKWLKYNAYEIKFDTYEQYKKHHELISSLIADVMEFYKIDAV